MDAKFWLERWNEGQTHFHQDRVTPLLQKFWPSLELPTGSRVLVPLCGKSLDLVWLASQGYEVLGVELSPLAVKQFFAENGLQPHINESAVGLHFVAGSIEIICGDIFALDTITLAECTGIYDRAALVALPADMRARYVRHVYAQLSDHYCGLLITLDYDQGQMNGPPFSVDDGEIQALYGAHSTATLIDRRAILDKEPKFAQRGLTQLDSLVYRLSAMTRPT